MVVRWKCQISEWKAHSSLCVCIADHAPPNHSIHCEFCCFGPYIQRYSKNRVLFWINDYRFKPFLQSYYAPLKDKYRSWIGLLLVLRLCLLIVFVSNSLGDPSINLFAIAVVVVLLFSWRCSCLEQFTLTGASMHSRFFSS